MGCVGNDCCYGNEKTASLFMVVEVGRQSCSTSPRHHLDDRVSSRRSYWEVAGKACEFVMSSWHERGWHEGPEARQIPRKVGEGWQVEGQAS